MISDKIWIENIEILIHQDRLREFIPNKEMSNSEKINAIVRFSLYLSVLLILIKNNYLYLYIFIGALALTYLIYIFDDKKETFIAPVTKQEEEKKIIDKECKKPTKENPFMNVLLTDDYSKTKKACKYTEDVKQSIDESFYDKIYNDTSNLYNQRNSQRQFYTMPSTTVPNEQNNFAKWCYKTPETCKEGNSSECIKNIYSPILRNTQRNLKQL